MPFRNFSTPVAKRTVGFATLATLAFLAACQSNSGDPSGANNATPEAPKVTQQELLAFCPSVVLREGTTFFNNFAKGGEGDKSKLIDQTSITDATRSCTRSGGQLTMKVAIAGKVVVGPLGKPGTVTLPIRIAVTNGEEVLYSQLHRYPVQVTSTAQATQFMFTDENVSFADPGTRGIKVFAGFDEGPPKVAAAE